MRYAARQDTLRVLSASAGYANKNQIVILYLEEMDDAMLNILI